MQIQWQMIRDFGSVLRQCFSQLSDSELIDRRCLCYYNL